jgi:hypothetical protein
MLREDMPNENDSSNQAAFRQLEGWIKEHYPTGRFVAIAGGKIVADAASSFEVRSALIALGFDPIGTLIIQAGGYYPEYVTILACCAR